MKSDNSEPTERSQESCSSIDLARDDGSLDWRSGKCKRLTDSITFELVLADPRLGVTKKYSQIHG